jgi:hypothetical protein
MIGRFVKLIFDGVYGNTSGDIEVIPIIENPKTATCKGGIEGLVSQDYETIDSIKTIPAGNDLDTFADEELTYADITEDMQNAVVQSVKDFFTFLFDLHSKYKDFLTDMLAADPVIFNQVKEFILGEKGEQVLSVSMFRGLKNKRREVNDDNAKLEETLFFYPLTGLLHDLALKITEMEENVNV